MPATVRDLGSMAVQTSSGGTANSSGTGHLDDASSITIFFTSSALSSASSIQVSQFDPADPFPQAGVTQSSGWFTLSTATLIGSSSASMSINNISFRGIRLSITATSSAKGEVLAFISKQISV